MATDKSVLDDSAKGLDSAELRNQAQIPSLLLLARASVHDDVLCGALIDEIKAIAKVSP